MVYTPPPPLPDGRTRYVYQEWLRKPDGATLTKPPPAGVRTPNELIWGHNLEDFCWIQRIPNVNVMTVWSRSMIKEHGENYDEAEFQEPDARQVPRLRHPWPVLKIPNDATRFPDEGWGIIDQGCEVHAQPEYMPKHRDDCAVTVDDARLETNATKAPELVIRELPSSLDVVKDILVSNDPWYPLRSTSGNIYAFLWKFKFRDLVFGNRPEVPQTTNQFPKLADGELVGIKADEYGIEFTDEGVGHLVSGQTLTSVDDDLASKIRELATDPPLETKQSPHPQREASDTSETSSNTSSIGNVNNENEASSDTSFDTNSSELDGLSSCGPIADDSPFSTYEIPKLEENIPKYYFPDTLYVHDPHNVTTTDEHMYQYASVRTFPPKAPMVYKRLYPKLPRDDALKHGMPISPPREAHLHLAHQNRLGVGHHSLVHDAPLTLPTPVTAHSRNGKVRVAAKTAFPYSSARKFLANEGKMYSLFPEHLSQDWCGYNFVTPIKHPVPVGPVVPKFFGYYVPIVDGKSCEVSSNGPSPVLLLEHCGEDIEPSRFTPDERTECYSLMLRLHYAGFIQGSFYVRNLLLQPGPLTAPPEQRSRETPSFRVIDFGRGEEWNEFLGDVSDEEHVERKKREWGHEFVSYEDRRAHRELGICEWEY